MTGDLGSLKSELFIKSNGEACQVAYKQLLPHPLPMPHKKMLPKDAV
jgi:hypothetical protein